MVSRIFLKGLWGPIKKLKNFLHNCQKWDYKNKTIYFMRDLAIHLFLNSPCIWIVNHSISNYKNKKISFFKQIVHFYMNFVALSTLKNYTYRLLRRLVRAKPARIFEYLIRAKSVRIFEYLVRAKSVLIFV